MTGEKLSVEWGADTGVNIRRGLFSVSVFAMNATRWLCVTATSPTMAMTTKTRLKLLLSSHHDAHVGQSELGAELAPVEGTHVLDSGKGGDGDGSAYWEDWETVCEASINPFLPEERQFKGLTSIYIHLNAPWLLLMLFMQIRACFCFGVFVKHFLR